MLMKTYSLLCHISCHCHRDRKRGNYYWTEHICRLLKNNGFIVLKYNAFLTVRVLTSSCYAVFLILYLESVNTLDNLKDLLSWLGRIKTDKSNISPRDHVTTCPAPTFLTITGRTFYQTWLLILHRSYVESQTSSISLNKGCKVVITNQASIVLGAQRGVKKPKLGMGNKHP